MAVAVKATATHLRQVQRVRRNLRERRERLKRQGLRRGERHADGSEHWQGRERETLSSCTRKNLRCLIGSVRGERAYGTPTRAESKTTNSFILYTVSWFIILNLLYILQDALVNRCYENSVNTERRNRKKR